MLDEVLLQQLLPGWPVESEAWGAGTPRRLLAVPGAPGWLVLAQDRALCLLRLGAGGVEEGVPRREACPLLNALLALVRAGGLARLAPFSRLEDMAGGLCCLV